MTQMGSAQYIKSRFLLINLKNVIKMCFHTFQEKIFEMIFEVPWDWLRVPGVPNLAHCGGRIFSMGDFDRL